MAAVNAQTGCSSLERTVNGVAVSACYDFLTRNYYGPAECVSDTSTGSAACQCTSYSRTPCAFGDKAIGASCSTGYDCSSYNCYNSKCSYSSGGGSSSSSSSNSYTYDSAVDYLITVQVAYNVRCCLALPVCGPPPHVSLTTHPPPRMRRSPSPSSPPSSSSPPSAAAWAVSAASRAAARQRHQTRTSRAGCLPRPRASLLPSRPPSSSTQAPHLRTLLSQCRGTLFSARVSVAGRAAHLGSGVKCALMW